MSNACCSVYSGPVNANNNNNNNDNNNNNNNNNNYYYYYYKITRTDTRLQEQRNEITRTDTTILQKSSTSNFVRDMTWLRE